MFPYTPRIQHAALSTFFVVVFLLLSGIPRLSKNTLFAFQAGAFTFAVITAVVLALLILDAMNERVRVMTDWMMAFSKLDDEGRAAVAFTFPTMRYRMKRGEVRAMFEDTNVSMELFRLFLQTSNDRYISPRRDWYTSEKPEWAWEEIQAWLEANGYILADSAAGSHSWLWSGNSYHHLLAYWMAGRKLENFNIGTEAVNEE